MLRQEPRQKETAGLGLFGPMQKLFWQVIVNVAILIVVVVVVAIGRALRGSCCRARGSMLARLFAVVASSKGVVGRDKLLLLRIGHAPVVRRRVVVVLGKGLCNTHNGRQLGGLVVVIIITLVVLRLLQWLLLLLLLIITDVVLLVLVALPPKRLEALEDVPPGAHSGVGKRGERRS